MSKAAGRLLFTATIPQGIFMRILLENPRQQCTKYDRREYLHSVCLRYVHFVAMNSGAVNSNEGHFVHEYILLTFVKRTDFDVTGKFVNFAKNYCQIVR